jgi:hypothetical protein
MISVRGRFVDNRRPDISNLFKIISDAVQDGLGVNDKYFRLHDDGYATGFENPYLVIRVATWEVSYGQSELE